MLYFKSVVYSFIESTGCAIWDEKLTDIVTLSWNCILLLYLDFTFAAL